MCFWNPLLVMILIPLFEYFLYPIWRWCQPSLNDLHKMLLGMVFIMLCYIICGFVQLSVENNPGDVSVFWQLPQYILLSVGEVLVAITILNFSYTQAPLSLKAFTASLNLLMESVGNMVAGVVYSCVRGFERHNIFFLFAGMMMANIIVFVLFARRYRFKDYSDKKCKVEMEENVVAEQSSEFACRPYDQSNVGKVPVGGSDERGEPEVVRRRKILNRGLFHEL